MCITVHWCSYTDLVEQCNVSTQADMFLACSSPLQQESENAEYKGLADLVKWAFHMNICYYKHVLIEENNHPMFPIWNAVMTCSNTGISFENECLLTDFKEVGYWKEVYCF